MSKYSPIIQKIILDLATSRVYLTKGRHAPHGRRVIHTKRGKDYYEPKEHTPAPFDVTSITHIPDDKIKNMPDDELRHFISSYFGNMLPINKEQKELYDSLQSDSPDSVKDRVRKLVGIQNIYNGNIFRLVDEVNSRCAKQYLKEHPEYLSPLGISDLINRDKDKDIYATQYPNKSDKRQGIVDIDDSDKISDLIINAYKSKKKVGVMSDMTQYVISSIYSSPIDTNPIIKKICESVTTNRNIFKGIISEFNGVCDKLEIPALRAQQFEPFEYDDEGNASKSIMATMGEGALYINPDLMTKEPDLELKSKDRGYKPKLSSDLTSTNSDRFKMMMWHEMGHQIVRYYIRSAIRNGDDPDIAINMRKMLVYCIGEKKGFFTTSNACDELFSEVFEKKDIPKLNTPRFGEDSDLDYVAPSDYGKVSAHECFAESYALHKAGMDDKISVPFRMLFERLNI